MVFTQGPLSRGDSLDHDHQNASVTFSSDGDGGTPSISVQAANTWYDIRDTYIVRFVVDGCRKNLPLGDPDQLNANPYEPTDLTPSERSALPPKSWHLRAAICVHLFAVGASIVVSRIDTGMLDLPGPVETFAYSMMYPCLLAMFVCPVVVLHYALRSTLSPLRRILVIAVDACVVFAHFFALIPLVQ